MGLVSNSSIGAVTDVIVKAWSSSNTFCSVARYNTNVTLLRCNGYDFEKRLFTSPYIGSYTPVQLEVPLNTEPTGFSMALELAGTSSVRVVSLAYLHNGSSGSTGSIVMKNNPLGATSFTSLAYEGGGPLKSIVSKDASSWAVVAGLNVSGSYSYRLYPFVGLGNDFNAWETLSTSTPTLVDGVYLGGNLIIACAGIPSKPLFIIHRPLAAGLYSFGLESDQVDDMRLVKNSEETMFCARVRYQNRSYAMHCYDVDSSSQSSSAIAALIPVQSTDAQMAVSSKADTACFAAFGPILAVKDSLTCHGSKYGKQTLPFSSPLTTDDFFVTAAAVEFTTDSSIVQCLSQYSNRDECGYRYVWT